MTFEQILREKLQNPENAQIQSKVREAYLAAQAYVSDLETKGRNAKRAVEIAKADTDNFSLGAIISAETYFEKLKADALKARALMSTYFAGFSMDDPFSE